jgi:tungstate transport system substrate-binding protein
VETAASKAFIDWLVAREGQPAIASYRMNGERLFFPNAAP